MSLDQPKTNRVNPLPYNAVFHDHEDQRDLLKTLWGNKKMIVIAFIHFPQCLLSSQDYFQFLSHIQFEFGRVKIPFR